MSLSLFDTFKEKYAKSKVEVMPLGDYLELCKTEPMAYATAPERMIAAIGEPQLVDTASDPRLSRVFLNRTVKVYPAFKDFYGTEAVVERIVSYFRQAAQGLEERKQVLYLLGPVGGGKSSIAERLKQLMEANPIYVLAVDGPDGKPELSPVFETPLGLFPAEHYASTMAEQYGINKRYLNTIMSPWASKRLREFEGDITQFKVAKVWPSRLEQIAICKTEPGDENNQDISCLVGKTDIRKLEFFSQNDPDAYAFSGALNRGNQGIMEFVEMFKAPIKVLHPLLTATQEGNYVGTEAISAIPFNGTILAHSNESEWQSFRNNKNNEAFLDRICVIKVPYCLRDTEESNIYQKMLNGSTLSEAPLAPETLSLLSRFSVLSRLKDHPNSTLWSKMRVYDGANMKETDPRSKSVQEYRDDAGVDEGMNGISTRFAFKILSNAFNYDTEEIGADPVLLMMVLEEAIRREQFPAEIEKKYLGFLKDDLVRSYAEFVGSEIQTAYLEAYDEYGQNLFDRYIEYADHWLQEIDYKDPDTGNLFNRAVLNNELEKIEKAAGIGNPKDFRHETVNFVLRQRARGNSVTWTSYEKLKRVIEKKMFSSVEELLPVISFGSKQDKDTERKHKDFVERMEKKGYTARQTRRIVEWYMRTRKSG
jgi:serine protein kinase